MLVLNNTVKELESLAEKETSALVSFSGGKDSRVVLDLALRFFKKVVCFHFYRAPGLRYTEEVLSFARERGVPVLRYPSVAMVKCLRLGVYCDRIKRDDWPKKFGLFDLYRLAMADSGMRLVLTGMRKADSPGRRFNLDKRLTRVNVRHPLREWKTDEVVAYMRIRKIEAPPSADGGRSFGAGSFQPESLFWLRENYPDDYDKLLCWFPYLEALLWREEHYPKAAKPKKLSERRLEVPGG